MVILGVLGVIVGGFVWFWWWVGVGLGFWEGLVIKVWVFVGKSLVSMLGRWQLVFSG